MNNSQINIKKLLPEKNIGFILKHDSRFNEKLYGFTPDDQYIAIATKTTLNLLDLEGNIVKTFNPEGQISGVAFSSDNKLLAIAVYEKYNQIVLFDLETNKKINQFPITNYPGKEDFGSSKDDDKVFKIVFSPDNQAIATLGEYISVKDEDDEDEDDAVFYSIKTWSLDGEILNHVMQTENECREFAFSKDGKYIASGVYAKPNETRYDGDFTIWNANDSFEWRKRNLIKRLTIKRSVLVKSIIFSQDNQLGFGVEDPSHWYCLDMENTILACIYDLKQEELTPKIIYAEKDKYKGYKMFLSPKLNFIAGHSDNIYSHFRPISLISVKREKQIADLLLENQSNNKAEVDRNDIFFSSDEKYVIAKSINHGYFIWNIEEILQEDKEYNQELADRNMAYLKQWKSNLIKYSESSIDYIADKLADYGNKQWLKKPRDYEIDTWWIKDKLSDIANDVIDFIDIDKPLIWDTMLYFETRDVTELSSIIYDYLMDRMRFEVALSLSPDNEIEFIESLPIEVQENFLFTNGEWTYYFSFVMQILRASFEEVVSSKA